MKKTILISREGGETRACLLASGQLVNIDAEGTSGSSSIGNIYKGKISDISRSLNAAFVDIGTSKEGFLSINDVHPAILDGFPRRPYMSDIFSRHQTVLVQVVRDAIGDKGAMLTTCISLPGRYVVLMPAVEKTGISKKLPDEERQRLREIIEEVEIPEGFGVIVRTAGQDRKKAELLKDLNELIKVWNQIEAVYNESPAPSLVLQEQSLAIRFLREYLTPDVNEIVVDDEALKKEVGRFLTVVMPKFKKVLDYYTDRLPLFVRYNVEGQIEKMFLRDVPLPSGGRIVIDKTEALIAVDVNSGRHKEKDIEETALRTNLEAAQEIAIQCKLRDLGGLVVIDFIDMYQQKNRNQVQQHLKECFKDDKAKVSFGKISQFGLLEMTRQKLRSGMVSRATESCSRCGGVGYMRTVSSMGLHVLRRIREMVVSGNVDTITVTAPVEVANFMHNSLRSLLLDLEQLHGVRVVILGRADIVEETIEGSRQERSSRKEGAAVEATSYAATGQAEDEIERPTEADEQPVRQPEEDAGRGPAAETAQAQALQPAAATAQGRAAVDGSGVEPAPAAKPAEKRRRKRGSRKTEGSKVQAGAVQAASKPEATGQAQEAAEPVPAAPKREGRGKPRSQAAQLKTARRPGTTGKPVAKAGPDTDAAGKSTAEAGADGASASSRAVATAGDTATGDAEHPGTEPRSKRRRRRGRRGRSGDQELILGEPVQGEPTEATPASPLQVREGSGTFEPPPIPPKSSTREPAGPSTAARPEPVRTTPARGPERKDYVPPGTEEQPYTYRPPERASWEPASPANADEKLGRDGLLDTILKRLLGLDR